MANCFKTHRYVVSAFLLLLYVVNYKKFSPVFKRNWFTILLELLFNELLVPPTVSI